MLQTSSGGFFRGFAVRCASELLWGLPVRVMQAGGVGGWADNVHLCRVHRAGSMKWPALLLYVVLVLRLSNVADLRLKRASSCPRKVVSGILNKLKIHEFPRRDHDFACFPLSSAASTLLVREPGLNPRKKKHYIQHVSNP